MEDISKKQLFLLLLLVSVVTGVSSTVIVFTLLEQTPPPITNTIQKVIERTSEKTPLSQDAVVGLEQAALARDALIIDIAKRVSPAVVSVIATKDVPVLERYNISPFLQGDPFGNLFPDFTIPQYRQKGTSKQQVSAGSGFFVSQDGFIITNRHVVEDVAADYTVVMNNGKKLPAKVLARDPLRDMAVLQVAGTGYPSVPLGNSDSAQVGQSVIAIGNALGEFQNTVSVGVISGLRRTLVALGGLSGPEELSEVIQTDAAINPGNSGGPLLNLKGEAVGLNTAIAEGAQNIAFTIPINQIKKSLRDVKTSGKIVYPFIGVRYVQITPELKSANSLPADYGILVSKGSQGEAAITPGSPADKAGIQEGDIIFEFGGTQINSDNTFLKLIEARDVGDRVSLKLLRNGKEMTISVTLEARK